MNRKFLFIALAIALPLALIMPMRAARSWQPRVLELPTSIQMPDDEGAGGDFFWRSSGLTLTNIHGDLPTLEATHWNGARIPVRVMPGLRAEMNRAGDLAIYSWAHDGRASNVNAWDVAGERVISTLESQAARDNRERRITFGTRALALSPDGTRAVWNGVAPDDLVIANARTGVQIARFDVPRDQWRSDSARSKLRNLVFVKALAFAPDANELAVVGINGVRIVDAHTGRVRRWWALPPNTQASRARWSPDGRYLALADGRNAHSIMFAQIIGATRTRNFLTVFDARTGNLLRSWSQTFRDDTESYGATNLDFSPDSSKLAWGTFRGEALLMDIASGHIERRFSVAPAPKPMYGLRSIPYDNSAYVAYAPDGNTLAIATREKIALWRLN